MRHRYTHRAANNGTDHGGNHRLSNDTTLATLLTWCAEAGGGPPAIDVQPLRGDAGFRRYWRLRYAGGSSLIAAHAPPETENNEAFVALGGLLRGGGVNVPKIHAVDRRRGFLLLSDLGNRQMLDALEPGTADALYQQAMHTLTELQACAVGDARWSAPRYSPDMLAAEWALFPQWFVHKLLNRSLSRAERALLAQARDLTLDAAAEQAAVLVHRDYHSRNLMLSESGVLGVLDFQDGVVGPISYDLVSLLKDCYRRWPREHVCGWAERYRQRALACALPVSADPAQWLRWFDLTGLQRHAKVLGIFARLWLRDRKPGYLNDLPRVVAYAVECAAAYPELDALHGWWRERLLPDIRRQPWWRESALDAVDRDPAWTGQATAIDPAMPKAEP